MSKKIITVAFLCLTTVATITQTQQPAKAGLLEDLGAYLEASGNYWQNSQSAVDSDGSVNIGKFIVETGKYYQNLDRIGSDYSRPQYPQSSLPQQDQSEPASMKLNDSPQSEEAMQDESVLESSGNSESEDSE